jgi:hypothetical protein
VPSLLQQPSQQHKSVTQRASQISKAVFCCSISIFFVNNHSFLAIRDLWLQMLFYQPQLQQPNHLIQMIQGVTRAWSQLNFGPNLSGCSSMKLGIGSLTHRCFFFNSKMPVRLLMKQKTMLINCKITCDAVAQDNILKKEILQSRSQMRLNGLLMPSPRLNSTKESWRLTLREIPVHHLHLSPSVTSQRSLRP